MKKFSFNSIKVAQINSKALSEHTIGLLKSHAEFRDTDPTLEELIISTGTINEIVIETKGKYQELCDLNIEVMGFAYIHVIFL